MRAIWRRCFSVGVETVFAVNSAEKEVRRF